MFVSGANFLIGKEGGKNGIIFNWSSGAFKFEREGMRLGGEGRIGGRYFLHFLLVMFGVLIKYNTSAWIRFDSIEAKDDTSFFK